MTVPILRFDRPVTLVGGGALDAGMLAEARALAPHIIAADGAADKLAAMGVMPEAIVGDMDSLLNPADWDDRPARLIDIPEQETTDFEKCLYATEAPAYVGAGFIGRRLDHTLATFHGVLARPDKTILLLGEMEVVALVPPNRAVALDVTPGTTVSFFPLLTATGTLSEGLEWSVHGLTMIPGTQIGTSNRASIGRVTVAFDRPGILMMVPRRYASALLDAIS